MGMFDALKCEVALPDGYVGNFQTKDFECDLDHYVIHADGTLEVLRFEMVKRRITPTKERGTRESKTLRWEPVNFHGVIRFYDYDREGLPPLAPYDPDRWHEYEAKFTDGRLVEIRQLFPVPMPNNE